MTFKSCLSVDSCVDGSSTAVLPSDAGSTKTLVSFDLMEDRKYSASVTVLYNGGVEQQSQSVEISEFVQFCTIRAFTDCFLVSSLSKARSMFREYLSLLQQGRCVYQYSMYKDTRLLL